MIKDLRHYIHVQQEYFPKELMDKTVSEMKSIDWQTHTFYNPNKEESKPRSGEQELSVSWSDKVSTKNDITKSHKDYITTGFSTSVLNVNYHSIMRNNAYFIPLLTKTGKILNVTSSLVIE